MAIGDDLKADVGALIDEVGSAVTIRQTPVSNYDPATGTVTAGTTTDTSGVAYIGSYNDRVVDGTLIKQGDRKCLLKTVGLTATPAIGDQIIADDGTYNVISLKLINLQGTILIYNLQLRLGAAR